MKNLEKREKNMTFSVPVEKQENGKTINYKVRFIESVQSMISSLSSLTDNLAKGLYKGKCKDCKSSLEYLTAKDGLLVFKCVDNTKTYDKRFYEDSFKRFKSIYQF